MAAWEYLFLVAELSAELVGDQRTGQSWEHKTTFAFWRDGPEPAETREFQGASELPVVPNVLNELGRDGWELVHAQVRIAGVGPHGAWPQAGVPVIRDWVFKRPVG